MANPQTVQISNPYSIRSRELNREMKKARKAEKEAVMIELEQELMKNDWESSAYWDDEKTSFFLPDTVLLAAIRDGATASKQGKDVDRAVIVTETQAYISTKKFKSLDDAFTDPAFRLSGPCKIPPKKGSLIWKCRCMIPTGWTITFGLEFDEKIFPGQSMTAVQETTGARSGVGGWRPKFGRFVATLN